MIRNPSVTAYPDRLLLILKHRNKQKYSTFAISPSRKETIDTLLKDKRSFSNEI